MKKVLTIIVGASLFLGSVGATGVDAKKPKKRTVKTPYTEPAVGAAGVGVCFQGASCAFLAPLPGERFVSVEVVDDLGLPVSASIIQDTNGDGNYLAADDETTHFCGTTAEPLEIEPETVTVWVWRGPGLVPPCPGMASSGVIKSTFSAAP